MSRNPTSGKMEFYTDEGILVGSAVAMGDLVTLPDDELSKMADDRLAGSDVRKGMNDIAETMAKLKKAGASDAVLQKFYNQSGFSELSERAKEEKDRKIKEMKSEA